MNGIYHKIGIRAGTADILKALTTKTGLAGWWTREVEGQFSNGASRVGESIRFDFEKKGGFDMKVKTVAPERVTWECTDGPDEWIGSQIDFSLKPVATSDGATMTLIHFRHQDWKTENDFTAHCSMKWAIFLLSLRSLLEVGKGQPAPEDVKIDEFN
ncbi:MAG: SRPBCC domain-containing protein [Leptospirales bacterium]|nr:SRPBCC domain-containing protein [Leptospirales bacterium]